MCRFPSFAITIGVKSLYSLLSSSFREKKKNCLAKSVEISESANVSEKKGEV